MKKQLKFRKFRNEDQAREFWSQLDLSEHFEPNDFTSLAEGRRLVYASVMKQPVVTISPEVMGGTPVFADTRVPVQTLFDYLEAGDTIDEFLEGFPTVEREQVIAFLEEAKIRMLVSAR